MDNERIAKELRRIAKSIVSKQDIEDMGPSQLANEVFDIVDEGDDVLIGRERRDPQVKEVKSISVSPESVKIEVSDTPEIKLTKRKIEKLLDGEEEFEIKKKGERIYFAIL